MWRYIYGTSRDRNYSNSIDLQQISLNGGYTTEFFNYGQFKDFSDGNIVKLSMPIPNDRFIGQLPKIDDNEQIIGSVPKLTRFVMLKYSDLYTNSEDLTTSIEKSSSDTNVQIFKTIEEARQWIRDNTNLVEIETGKFLINPEIPGLIDGEIIPASYLIIE